MKEHTGYIVLIIMIIIGYGIYYITSKDSVTNHPSTTRPPVLVSPAITDKPIPSIQHTTFS